jgi:hypothetical protein
MPLTPSDAISYTTVLHYQCTINTTTAIGYGKARDEFVDYLKSSAIKPFHLWVVVSWIGIVWSATRELEGLTDVLMWAKQAVPERFRGTNVFIMRRMHVSTCIHYYSCSVASVDKCQQCCLQ